MTEDSYSNFCDLKVEQSKDKINEIFNTSIESINDEYNHYICTKCYKFPFIKFCKNMKNVRLTCSCFNNKKISIEELFKIIDINDIRENILSESILNINIENHLFCKKHKKKFKGFSKFYLLNFCEDCYDYQFEIYNNDIIRFDDIRIDEKKIYKIIEKIIDNKDIYEELSEEKNNNIKLYIINENTYGKLLEEEEIRFKKLIDVIINDYKNYPNFSHFFNLKNLLYFFNIEDNSIEKEGNIIDGILIEKNEPIIIEYINNISNKTKLFSLDICYK